MILFATLLFVAVLAAVAVPATLIGAAVEKLYEAATRPRDGRRK